MMLDGEKGAIAQFIRDCQVRGLSEQTLSNYTRYLRIMIDSLEKTCSVTELEKVTVNHLRECVLYLLSPDYKAVLSANTVRLYVRVWKVFFNWCYQEELLDVNPTSRLRSPKPENHVKQTFTSEQVQAILDSCDLSTEVGFRDYVIFSLMADTGLRLSEVASLEVDNVYSTYIKVRGKGRKEREIGLHPEVSKLLWKYMNKYRRAGGDETALFLGHKGPLKKYGIEDIIKRAKKRCGLDVSQFSAHIFRHTFSKQYIDHGGDVLRLSRELGHSDIKITEIYLRDFSSTDARKEHPSRSVFNDIKVQKRKKPKRRRDD
jgi:integrase/recombinase XerD